MDRVARQGWAWMLPAFGVGFGVGGQELFDADRLPFAVAGLVLGAGWQLLYRRDLVERLTAPMVAMCVMVVWVLASGEKLTIDEESYSTTGVVLYVGGMLAGLVLAEQYLRRRDRLSPAAPAPTPESARP